MKVFDFDNTIYNGESLLDFYNYFAEKKEKLQKYRPIVNRVFTLYKHNMLPMGLFKKLVDKYKGEVDTKTLDVDKYINEFWKEHKDNLNKEILDKIGKDDVIISANFDIMINPIKDKLKTKHIYTSIADIEKKEIIFLCYKENKVKKFREIYKDAMIDELYTDSYADKPLMQIAKKVFMVDKKTREIKQIK